MMDHSEQELFVTLEISANTITPSKLKERFGIESAFTSDDAAARIGVPPSNLAPFWSLSTRGKVFTNRLVEHVRWMADQLIDNQEVLDYVHKHESLQLYAQGPERKWEADFP